MNPFSVITTIADLGGKVMDRWFPPTMSEADKERARQEFQVLLQQAALQDQQIRAHLVLAEIQGESWLQRNWRPILMLSIVGIVVNNAIIFPILQAFGVAAIPLELTDALWTTLQIGLGGYVVGRSAEKIADTWKGHPPRAQIEAPKPTLPDPHGPKPY